jgi:hypothetical protein
MACRVRPRKKHVETEVGELVDDGFTRAPIRPASR